MDFILLKTIGIIAYTAIAFSIGKNWSAVNSVSDIESVYKDALAKFEALKLKVADEVKAAEDKAASLKSLL